MVFKFSFSFSKLLSTTLCIVGFLWTSCSNEDKDSAIVLDKSSIQVMAGAKDTVLILSGNNDCIVTTDNENVATAVIEGSNVIISTSEMGLACLTITDKSSRTLKINVDATGPRTGGWKEYFPIGVEYVFVEADNDIVMEQIKSQLIEEARNRIDAMYVFGNSAFSYQSRNSSLSQDGNYTVKDLILTLNYSGREEFYEIVGGVSIMQLKRNLTAYFKEQYPDAGISKIEECRLLKYITY